MNLYLVTNRHLAQGNFIEQIEEALLGGVDAVILREKDLDDRAYFDLALKVKELTDRLGLRLIINGPLESAKKLDVFAYHSPFEKFKRKGREYRLQGVSVHSLEEARFAEANGADYIMLGHIFETDCKKGLKSRGLHLIEEVRDRVDLPLLVIGGIDEENLASLPKGLKGLALMSGLMTSSQPRLKAERIKNLMGEVE